MKNLPPKPIVGISYEDATVMILEDNGGYAPLRVVERELGKYKDLSAIKGKTPFHTVQALLQRKPRFVRIGLGVYALESYQKQGKLPEPPTAKTKEEKEFRQHAEIQGKLILIGNNRDNIAETYTGDRNSVFSGGNLGNVATLQKIHPFTYPKVVRSAGFVDVVWFNDRKYPSYFFEVEHTTNFINALTKFCDLQDFHAKFICVADESRRAKFDEQLQRPTFKAMRKRCEFRTYTQVESDYNHALQETHI